MAETFKYLRSVGIIMSISLFMYLLDPFSLGYPFGYLLVILVFFKKKFLLENLDANFAMICVFSISYALFYSFEPYQGQRFIYSYAIIPPGFYLFGKYLVNQHSTHKNIFMLLVAIGFVFSLTALISVMIVFLEGGFASINRSLPLFWNGSVIAATKMGGFFTFNMCLPGLLLVRQLKLSLAFKIIGAVIFILSLICVIRLGSRTQLAICAITMLISIFYVLWNQSLKKNIPMLFILSLLVMAMATSVSFDKDADWFTAYASRMEDKKNVASVGGRSGRWELAAANLVNKPLGWNRNDFGLAHNLWLDAAMVAGIIPFIFLSIFSIKSFFLVKKAIGIRPEQITFNLLLFVFGMAIFLIFFVEPILIGYFKLFAIFFIYMGVVVSYTSRFKKKSSAIVKLN